MICTVLNAAVRRYNRRMLVAAVVYIVTLCSTLYAIKLLHPSHAITILLAILPALPIIGMIGTVALYLKEQTDEFQRELLVQTLLWAAALTLTTTSVWGFLEMFAHTPRLPAFYVFVIFWFFFGAATVPLRMRYRTGPND